MRITSRSFLRSAIILFFVGFVAVVAIAAASLWLTNKTADYSQAVTDVRRMRSAAVDLRALLKDAETGQRGFLLTGDETYLAPYTLAIGKMPEQSGLLRERAEVFSDVEAVLGPLTGLIDAKLAELAQTIALARGGRKSEALALVNTGRGRRLAEEADAIFTSVVSQADARFAQRLAEQTASVDALQTVSLVGGLLILAVAGGAVWLVLRYTSELHAARGAIEALNAGLEERVRDRTVGLRRANDEIQKFAYIVTHDLRAPLVNIMGFTSELEASLAALKAYMENVEDSPDSREAKLSVDEDLPEALGFIRTSTRKMDGLINAILKLSRDGRRPLKPERLQLDVLLRAASDAVQHQLAEAEGNVAFSIKVPAIVSDRLTLEQTFGNLLDNAIKYHEPGRPLKVEISTAIAPGGAVSIAFKDNGRGIAPADHERVFELFRRSGKQDKAGEGIGLAHVRSGIRNLGGDISVASELGVGTTFTITLPRDLAAVIKSHEA